MTTHDVPTSLTIPGINGGNPIYMPGHGAYVPGTDRTDAFNWWLTRDPANLANGLRPDGFGPMSSDNPLNPNVIRFQAGVEYTFEYGTWWGLGTAVAALTDRSGIAWPKLDVFALKNIIIDGNGATWRQQDNTMYNDGTVITQASIVASGTSASNIITVTGAPLGANFRNRVLATQAAGSTVKIWITDSTGNIVGGAGGGFSGGGANWNAIVGSVSSDGVTITLSQGICNANWAAVTINIRVDPIESRRNNKLWMLGINSPGQKGLVERSWLTQNLEFRDLVIRMGNTAGAVSTYTEREQWHAIYMRKVRGLYVHDVELVDVWGDACNTGPAAETGLLDVGLTPEDVLIEDVRCSSCGRHSFTLQGQIGFTVRRFQQRDTGRWIYDSEPGQGVNHFDTLFEDCAFDNGAGFMTQHPGNYFGEPPWTVSGITQGSAANLIVAPAETFIEPDLGSIIVGAGIPAGTYLRRRFSPTSFELSKDVTIVGSITVTVKPSTMYRDIRFSYCDVYVGTPNFSGSTSCNPAKVYFSGLVDHGSNVMRDVQFEPWIDGQSWGLADVASLLVKIQAYGGLFPGKANAVPTAVDTVARTITMAGAAALWTDKGAWSPTVTYALNNVVQGTDGVFYRCILSPCLNVNPAGGANTSYWSTTLMSSYTKPVTGCTLTAGSRVVSTPVAQFANSDIQRKVTGPGVQPGTVVLRFASGKSVTLSKPVLAGQGGTNVTITIEGRHRFSVPLADNRWTGFHFDNVRNIGSSQWGGDHADYGGANAAMIMFPSRSDDVSVTHCFAPIALGLPLPIAQAVANVAALPSELIFGWITSYPSSGQFQIPTSTGIATIQFTGKTAVPIGGGNYSLHLTGCTLVSGSGSIASGAVSGVATHYAMGYYTGGNPTGWGANPSWTIHDFSNNRFPGGLDNQILTIPSVTTALVLTVDNATIVRPTFTIAFTRSDGGSTGQRGNVLIKRNGSIAGAAPLVNGVAQWQPFLYHDPPTATPNTWTAEWAGSWDTQGSASNAVIQNVGTAAATATTLVATPASPQYAGTPATLVATVTPNPGVGTVTFKDGATTIGTAAIDALTGAATLDVPAGFTVGTHPLTAVWGGNAGFLTSTSVSQNYVVTTAPTARATATSLSVSPPSPTEDIIPTTLTAQVIGL